MKLKFSIIIAILIVIVAIFIVSNKNDQASAKQPTNSASNTPEHARPSRTNSEHHRPDRKSTSTSLAQMSWEEKINHVLAADSISPDQASQILLRIVTDNKAPISVRNDALEHALNLIEDDSYDSILNIMGTAQNELPEPLVQTILDDTLNRTESIQLSTALVAILGSHKTTVEDAKELLEFHLDQDLGNNVQMWKKAVDTYRAEQAKKEEEATK